MLMRAPSLTVPGRFMVPEGCYVVQILIEGCAPEIGVDSTINGTMKERFAPLVETLLNMAAILIPVQDVREAYWACRPCFMSLVYYLKSSPETAE